MSKVFSRYFDLPELLLTDSRLINVSIASEMNVDNEDPFSLAICFALSYIGSGRIIVVLMVNFRQLISYMT